MAKLNVYVPDDLKRRMDKVKEPVNWSSLACEAFERKLGEIAEKKKVKAIDDVVQRLRASKIEDVSDLQKQGHDDGVDWAKHRATARELRRLDKVVQDCRGIGKAFNVVGSSAYCSGDHFVMAVMGDEQFSREDSYAFWETNAGRESEELQGEADYVCGFAEGALEVWNEVQDKI